MNKERFPNGQHRIFEEIIYKLSNYLSQVMNFDFEKFKFIYLSLPLLTIKKYFNLLNKKPKSASNIKQQNRSTKKYLSFL